MQLPFDFYLVKLCKFCDGVISRKSNHYKTKVFCTMKCRGLFLSKEMVGENHPNYSNGKAVKQNYICKNCEKEFISDKGYEGRTPQFCSIKCFGKSISIEIPTKKCNQCEKNFTPKYVQGRHFFCSNKCSAKNNGAKLKGVKRPQYSGAKSGGWRGGVTPINESLRKGTEYKEWRSKVFERDNYTCKECNMRGGRGKKIILNADHIKPFAFYPELRFEISNGRTLCIDCHRKTDTYGSKAVKYKRAMVC